MSGHPSRSHGADDDILGLPSNWARVSLVCWLLLKLQCKYMDSRPGMTRAAAQKPQKLIRSQLPSDKQHIRNAQQAMLLFHMSVKA